MGAFLGEATCPLTLIVAQQVPVRSLGAENITAPQKGSALISSRTRAARPSAPMRKSTGRVATITVTLR